jgi:hypothetical protein
VKAQQAWGLIAACSKLLLQEKQGTRHSTSPKVHDKLRLARIENESFFVSTCPAAHLQRGARVHQLASHLLLADALEGGHPRTTRLPPHAARREACGRAQPPATPRHMQRLSCLAMVGSVAPRACRAGGPGRSCFWQKCAALQRCMLCPCQANSQPAIQPNSAWQASRAARAPVCRACDWRAHPAALQLKVSATRRDQVIRRPVVRVILAGAAISALRRPLRQPRHVQQAGQLRRGPALQRQRVLLAHCHAHGTLQALHPAGQQSRCLANRSDLESWD